MIPTDPGVELANVVFVAITGTIAIAVVVALIADLFKKRKP